MPAPFTNTQRKTVVRAVFRVPRGDCHVGQAFYSLDGPVPDRFGDRLLQLVPPPLLPARGAGAGLSGHLCGTGSGRRPLLSAGRSGVLPRFVGSGVLPGSAGSGLLPGDLGLSANVSTDISAGRQQQLES
jgi:hypothetical protein